jgi:hypothetical protein
MRTIVVCVLAATVMANVVFGSEPAEVGSAFADVYGVFAPLAVLHRSYADYLFYGSDVVIPATLASACDETGYLLATLHLNLLTQTGAAVVATMPWLARLRANLAIFCDSHSQILTSITAVESPGIAVLKEASDLGLFAEIYRLQGGLQSTFEAYLEGLSDEESTWTFGVAFSLRTLLGQLALESVEPELRAILYGAEEATSPPAFVPESVSDAIKHLIAFVDVHLDATNLEEVRFLAHTIYEYVVEEI